MQSLLLKLNEESIWEKGMESKDIQTSGNPTFKFKGNPLDKRCGIMGIYSAIL